MQLPDSFIRQIQQLLPDESEAMLKAIGETEASVSCRVNEARGAHVPVTAAQVPWCPAGIYCDTRPQFTFDPMWHSGMYYVQDASSMFIHHVIKSLVKTPVRYLDLCAAPGGKTTAALQALPAGSMVVANEIVVSRARILVDNVSRWGNPWSAVTCCAPKVLGKLTHAFDVIAADVPCSGEGMFRKDDEAVKQWSPALVEQCAERQRSIIADIWPALRPGGLFIYSTCTYNTRENEMMVKHLVDDYGAEVLEVPVAPQWPIHAGVNTDHPCYRFLPHLTRGEGLFMAVVCKPADEPLRPARPAKQRMPARGQVPKDALQWVDDKAFALALNGDTVVATPREHAALLSLLEQCNLMQAGTPVCTLKGKNCIPAHALALSTALQRDKVVTAEADYPTAIAYLRGEAISVDAPRGYVAVTHRGAPLGWVNNLGNRANNMYPKPLRILSTHTPDTPPTVL